MVYGMSHKQKPSKITGVAGYVRVSTAEQVANGHSLDAQRTAIVNACLQRDWPLMGIYSDEGISGADPTRPGLESAIKSIKAGEANVLMAQRFDRIMRSTLYAAELIDDSVANGWQIVTLDMHIDMTTPIGKAIAGFMSVLAELERSLIAERIRQGMAAGKAKGKVYGRPRRIDPSLEERIVTMYQKDDMSVKDIIGKLNGEGTLTPSGKPWKDQLVRKVLYRNLPEKEPD